jgi:GNAT superfamily N-acetyltransferase
MKTLSFLDTLRVGPWRIFAISCSLLCLQQQRFVAASSFGTTVTMAAKMKMLAWQFRSATPEDIAFARKTMIQQAMNPLSVSKERLLVAFDDEEDSTDTATGDAAAAAPNGMLGFGQIRPLDDLYAELASLYVLPNKRGKGIGGALVQELLSRHDDANEGDVGPSSQTKVVVLLTLRPTAPLYEKYGFEILNDMSEMPLSLQFEYKAGSIVSAFLGNDLVCMTRSLSQKQVVGS